MERCEWANSTPAMQEYHDTVWGKPEYEDQQLFRKLVLDMNQAGLSWQTILNKMANFDAAYDQFNIIKVANYTEEKVEELMMNPGIIRNRRKIEAAIINAQEVLKSNKNTAVSPHSCGDMSIMSQSSMNFSSNPMYRPIRKFPIS